MVDVETVHGSHGIKRRFVDIVVPTHGRPTLLRGLLNRLAPQLRSASECGIIVVNDGTHTPAYSTLLQEFDGSLEYVSLDEPRGPASARNIGGQRSRAEFIIFTDDDCSPSAYWLDWILARLESLPDIDVIGGTTVPAAPSSSTVIEQYNRALRLYPRPLFSRREMFCLPTANVAVRRSVFLKVGGFDVSFRFAAGEDTEFFYRLRMNGARFFIDMDWQTEHPIADTARSFLRRWYRYGYGNSQHRMKTGDPFENGLPSNLTMLKILRDIPKYVENRRNAVLMPSQQHDDPLAKGEWSLAFTLLAAAQRFAYRYGGYHAYRTEAPSAQRSAPQPAKKARIANLPVNSSRPVPRFGLIIGAMKCGTSALFGSLSQHPAVAPCRLKEPRFFFDEAERAKGTNWYLELFDYEPQTHKIAVEATTRNTMLPLYRGTARRMYDTGWHFRFVYLVRDPIQRIQSHYLHGAVADFQLTPLSTGVDPLPIQFSRYHHQLEPYRLLFGRESLLVIAHDEWKLRPEHTLERVCRHFEIDPALVGKSEPRHVSEDNYRRTLLIQQLRLKRVAPANLSAHNVRDVLNELSGNVRAEIETAVDSQFRLTEAQAFQVRSELAEDMRLFQNDYGIDVTRWGFLA